MALNIPVLVGIVPLFKVQTYVVTEGYKAAAIPGSSFVQMVGLATKTIAIDALLVGAERAFRPALEAMAQPALLSSIGGALGAAGQALGTFVGTGLSGVGTGVGAAGSATQTVESILGVPVVSKNFIHLDMQITQLKFTQDNQSRETLTVHIDLTSVPRAKTVGVIGAGADLALAVGSAFL